MYNPLAKFKSLVFFSIVLITSLVAGIAIFVFPKNAMLVTSLETLLLLFLILSRLFILAKSQRAIETSVKQTNARLKKIQRNQRRANLYLSKLALNKNSRVSNHRPNLKEQSELMSLQVGKNQRLIIQDGNFASKKVEKFVLELEQSYQRIGQGKEVFVPLIRIEEEMNAKDFNRLLSETRRVYPSLLKIEKDRDGQSLIRIPSYSN